MARPKRHYTDADRAAAIAAYDAEPDGKARETRAADAAGVPRSTLQEWLADRDNAAPPDIRQETTEALGDVFNRVARLALQQAETVLATGEADPARLKDYMVAAAIATDKEQLLAGMPTSRVAMTQEERVRRAAELVEVASERWKAAAA